MMKNKAIVILVFIIIVISSGVFLISKSRTKTSHIEISKDSDIRIVPTMNDEIAQDTTWCGTFQLVWNDMIKEVVHQDVKFDEQLAMVDNLNKQDFNEESISEEYYYKKFGLKTLNLKKEIENGIKEKFNEKSAILDAIDWSDSALHQENSSIRRYIFYAMLKREFTYKEEFDKLENGDFAGIYKDVEYFGINDRTDRKTRNQVDVLYYNSEDDCAVCLNTIEGDEVILCKGLNGLTFNEIYEDITEKSNAYTGKKAFLETDYLKIPKISFDTKKEYTELQRKVFYSAEGEEVQIEKAIQSIQMELDEKGGKIKSEAVIDVTTNAAMLVEKEKPRYFNFDDKYVVFLKENGKDKPYFAATISDITKFQ